MITFVLALILLVVVVVVVVPSYSPPSQSLLESVDGALGEIYAADSLVLGGVVITLALSVAIRGAVVASRASDEATMRR